MIGFRGASRDAYPAYVGGFALKCRAMRRVREEMGFTNVVLMIPFVRRVEEAEKVIAQMAELGLLGVDRDSEIVAFDYDERDEGVKLMLKLAVGGCARNKIHSGLCGQAPSDYPDMAEYLVELGIDSISLNPDTVVKTTPHILDLEHRLGVNGDGASSREECLGLLASNRFGRLAVALDSPVIRPVNYVFDERSQSVAFRTADGSKFHALLINGNAAFEIDGIDPGSRTGWSVIILGMTEEVTSPAALRRLDGLGLATWTPGPKAHWMRIRAWTVTGRRITPLAGP